MRAIAAIYAGVLVASVALLGNANATSYYQRSKVSGMNSPNALAGGTDSSTPTQSQPSDNDATPDEFTIASLVGQNPGSDLLSSSVLITGINVAVPITVAGDPSAQISVAGGAYGTNGMISNGQSFKVRVTTPAATAVAQTQSVTVTVGGVSAAWSVGTRAADATPDSFVIAGLTGQEPSTAVISAPVAVSGIEAAVPITVSGDPSAQISVAGGAYGANGMISNGQSFKVRVTTPAVTAEAQTQSVTVTVGGVSAVWLVGTRAAITTPYKFSIVALTGQAPSTTVTSNTVVIKDIEVAVPISVTGDPSARISVENGAYSTSGMIGKWQSFRVQMTTPAGAASTQTQTATVTVGGVSATWSVSTDALDVAPDGFAIDDVLHAPLDSFVLSSAVTPEGYDSAAPITVSGGGSPQISIDGGPWVANGTISPGQSFVTRLTSAATESTQTVATVVVGGVPADFVVATGDATPDDFSYMLNQYGDPDTLAETFSFDLHGFDSPTTVSVSGEGDPQVISMNVGGESRSDWGASTVADPDNYSIIQFRMTTAPTSGVTRTVYITAGGNTTIWRVTSN